MSSSARRRLPVASTLLAATSVAAAGALAWTVAVHEDASASTTVASSSSDTGSSSSSDSGTSGTTVSSSGGTSVASTHTS